MNSTAQQQQGQGSGEGEAPAAEAPCYFDVATTEDAPSRFPSFLTPLVPEVSPLPWMVINDALAVTGCLLIIDLWYAANHGNPDEERPFATAFYLIWQYATCFFWTFETGLSASYQHFHLHIPLKWYTKLELAMAAYFLISTFRMLWQWNLLAYNIDQIWEIAFDTSLYVYLAIRSCQNAASASSTPIETEGSTSLRDLESSQGDASYRIMANDNGVMA